MPTRRHTRRPPARGPIRWARRRLLPALARLLTLLAALLVVVWLVGHTLTDRCALTQYLWWVPTLVVLAVAWPMVFVAWALERMASRLAGFRLRPVVTAALFAMTVFACFGAWNIHRYLAPARGGDLRVVYWNLAVDPGAVHPERKVLDREPDLAVVANPRWDSSRGPLLEALGGLGGADGDPSAVHLLFRGEIVVATRGRITRYGQATFDMGTTEPEDRGVVLFVEIAGIAARPTVVWVVDLPSAPAHWRMEVARRARGAVGAWRGPAMAADDTGRWVPQVDPGPFPGPDVVLGDFNTPRGSASLGVLAPGMAESHEAAGRGVGSTWPRPMPLLPIDLLFAGGDYRVRGHRVVDPGSGRHRMLVVELDAP
jgi:hypothetical protein